MPINRGKLGSFPVVDALPASGVLGQHATLATDGKTYQWNATTGAWEQIGTGAGGGAGIETTPIGTIVAYAGSQPPSGWLLCDGSLVSRTLYANLFSAIGTTYGAGDGSTTFALPDLRGRVSVGAGQGASLTNRVLGTTGGEENHTLSIGEMPSHLHSPAAGGTGGWPVANVGGGTTWVTLGSGASLGILDPTSALSRQTSSVGGGASHNTMQPYLVTNQIIKAASQPAGNALTLNQQPVPAVSLVKSTGQNISGTVWTTLSFNAAEEVADTDGMHDPTVNPTRITIKTPGIYMVSGWIGDGSTVAGQRSGSRWASILLNGAADIVYSNHNSPAADGATGITVAIAVKLNAGDYIELRGYFGIAGQTFPTIGRFSAVWMSNANGIVGDQPTAFCRVKRSTALSINSAVWTVVPLDQEINDTDSMHDPAVNPSRFTIRTPGIYDIVGRVAPVVNATGIRGVALYVNGAVVAENEETPQAGSAHGMDVANTVALNAGDYVELFAYQSSGAALNLATAEMAVTMVGPPARAVVPTAQAWRTATQSIPGASTATAVQFGGVDADTDGIWSAGTPSRLTVRTPGTYMIRGNVWYNTAALSAGNYVVLMIQKNGTNYVSRTDLPAGASSRSLQVSAVLDLAAGDYVELITMHSNAGAQNIDPQGFGSYSARFEMVKVASTGPTPENAPSSTPVEATHFVGNPGEPAFVNSWLHYDNSLAVPGSASQRNVQFRKDPMGKVRLSGVTKGGASGSVVFTLPPGYRPAFGDQSFSVLASGGIADCAVYADGRVTLTNYVAPAAVTTWCYLDGVEFDTQTVTSILTGPQGPKGDTGTTPVDPWHTVGATGEPAFGTGVTNKEQSLQFRKDPFGKVMIRGGINCPATAGALLFTLPVGYRPPNNYVRFACTDTAGAFLYIWVDTTGGVFKSGAATSADLAGIEFDTDTVTLTPMSPPALPVDSWHTVGTSGEPGFTNSWQNYGAPFNTAGFWKDSNGVVHLRGLVMSGAAAAAIFTLPVGYRPAGQELLTAVANAGGARIDVRTDGTIIVNSYFAGGTNAFVSLDGLTFKAA